ncbi:GntR family transcriptional regulator [Streptomyces sp. NPDC006265]|uniref:GntR family transcriptional regulator n=1 Tax=Streptomyces sp. NPDC006265 TaxID=3156740 RepID=UPI0033A45296
MADSWVNSAERIGSDLHLELTGTGGRRAALIRALREAVRSGRLAPGTRLPPYRSLAADLGVARNTVADAYAELVAEGWLTARQGSGTSVAALAVHAPHIEVTGVAAGLHAVLRLPPGTEASAVKAAAWQGVALDGLAAFRHPETDMPVGDGLVVGYATPSEHAYGSALEALCGVLPPP